MDPLVIEATLHSYLDRASNGEQADLPDHLIEEAGEQFKAALKKQFTPREKGFRLRMSNIGRPLCQLQQAKMADDAGVETATRMPYNHIVRMLIGDCTEVLMRAFLKAAGVPVTSDGDKVELEVAGEVIKGESDIDLDGKVYDIKSSSPWGFQNKWLLGYRAIADKDTFGYVGQMLGYSDGQGKEPGGWITVDKSSGEVCCVPFEADEREMKRLRKDRENAVVTIQQGYPFMRKFEPEDETYYGKPTGAKRVPDACKFCDFKSNCWPEAEMHVPPKSRAKNPVKQLYVEHPEMEAANG